MDSEAIKWIYDLKVGDKIYYKHNKSASIKMSIIDGISKKCIYANTLRMRKYTTETTIYHRGRYGYIETIELINPITISVEDKIKFERNYLIEKLLAEKKLENLTLEELKNIYLNTKRREQI